jgi:hypothetical protein
VSDDRAADSYSEHSLRVSSAIGKSSKVAKIGSCVSTVEGRPTRPLGKALPRARRAAPALRALRQVARATEGGPEVAVADSGSGPTPLQSKHNRRPAQLAYYLYEGGRALAAGSSVPRARTLQQHPGAEVEAAGAAGCEANSMPGAIGRSGLFCL